MSHHIWNGEPLDGKRVLVRCHHGLGDTIHFIRFATLLRRIAAKVIVQTQPALLSTVAAVAGVDHAIPLTAQWPDGAFDAAIEVMELAHALRVDARTIRSQKFPYIPAALRCRQSGRRATIGLVWSAGDWARERSVPITLLAPLAELPGLRVLSLQRGVASSEAGRISAIDAGSDDVEQTIDVLQGLDLLITVDSFPAHLAGALGVPVWLLLQKNCDWRWMKDTSTSIWYPSMTLFRQEQQGDWQPVVDAVAARLQAGQSDLSGARVA